MKRLAPLALALVLLALAGQAAATCPLCNDGAGTAGPGTSVWWAVGAFLLVPPILGAGVLAFLRKELGAKKDRRAAAGTALTDGLVRFGN